MTMEPKLSQRLIFLIRVIRKESRHLLSTDQRLFAEPFTRERAARLDSDSELAERVEAFVGRFGRLQDTLGDKLLPLYLVALGETSGAAIDNLDRAERLGFVASADEWVTMRKLRNQMIHEYIEDLTVLSSALQTGHEFVSTLVATADTLIGEVERRVKI